MKLEKGLNFVFSYLVKYGTGQIETHLITKNMEWVIEQAKIIGFILICNFASESKS